MRPRALPVRQWAGILNFRLQPCVESGERARRKAGKSPQVRVGYRRQAQGRRQGLSAGLSGRWRGASGQSYRRTLPQPCWGRWPDGPDGARGAALTLVGLRDRRCKFPTPHLVRDTPSGLSRHLPRYATLAGRRGSAPSCAPRPFRDSSAGESSVGSFRQRGGKQQSQAIAIHAVIETARRKCAKSGVMNLARVYSSAAEEKTWPPGRQCLTSGVSEGRKKSRWTAKLVWRNRLPSATK
jgi:hypothetical protein